MNSSVRASLDELDRELQMLCDVLEGRSNNGAGDSHIAGVSTPVQAFKRPSQEILTQGNSVVTEPPQVIEKPPFVIPPPLVVPPITFADLDYSYPIADGDKEPPPRIDAVGTPIKVSVSEGAPSTPKGLGHRRVSIFYCALAAAIVLVCLAAIAVIVKF